MLLKLIIFNTDTFNSILDPDGDGIITIDEFTATDGMVFSFTFTFIPMYASNFLTFEI